jgi:hypothetical protein
VKNLWFRSSNSSSSSLCVREFLFESFDDRGQRKKTALLQASKKKWAFWQVLLCVEIPAFRVRYVSQLSEVHALCILPTSATWVLLILTISQKIQARWIYIVFFTWNFVMFCGLVSF